MKMIKRLSRLMIIASAAVIAQSPVLAQSTLRETWMGMYLGHTKIGHAMFSIDKANFEGKTCYKMESLSFAQLLVMGEEVEQTLKSTVYLNTDYEPICELFSMTSAGHTTTVVARFGAEEILADVVSEGEKTHKSISIPAGSRIIGDSTFFSATMDLKLGDKLSFKSFNPLTLTLDDIQTEVLRKEEISLGDESHDAFVIKSVTPLGEMMCWQGEDGNLLKVTALMGIIMIREPKDVAISLPTDSGSYRPPSDLAVITSAPAASEIPDPRAVKYMKVRIAGLTDKSLIISDHRQVVTVTGSSKLTIEYEIRAGKFDRKRAASLPIRDEGIEKYLQEGPYVQPGNPEITAIAEEVAGKETNSYAVVSRLRKWVSENMKSKHNIGIVRSSVDILHAKAGVCRDYAILYTALARAAGVPTKLVAGLVYWRGGFYYHAWAESFVGQWVPVDPTLYADFVDATHIKLAEGDATAMFDMVKTMGALEAEILEFK